MRNSIPLLSQSSQPSGAIALIMTILMILLMSSPAHSQSVSKEATVTTATDSLSSPQPAAAAPKKRRIRVPPISIPLIGQMDVASLSLPVLTLTMAGLDSINPCAFFVLLFLLSLLVHARDRGRMLLIGVLFVLTSGLLYFAFMSAWLNLFLVVGNLGWITLVAGSFAVVVALINIKDFFWFKKGISLSIPEKAKPHLFKKMRKLVASDNLPGLMFGTLVLAVTANSYELLCTAGFPMIFTRVLTLEQLPETQYYLYLAAYNVIYVIPLLVIVLLFVRTLGQRKLSEQEGRFLKLLSGIMMLELGLLLLFVPELLSNILTAVTLLISAILVTWIALKFNRQV